MGLRPMVPVLRHFTKRNSNRVSDSSPSRRWRDCLFEPRLKCGSTRTMGRRPMSRLVLLHPHPFSPTFPRVTAECILACAYFIVGPFFWGFLGFGIINGRGKMEILKRPSSPVPQPPPRVAVLI